MCGIFGTTINYSKQQIQDKLTRTAFRGPDKMDWKTFHHDTILTFGHNRLAIVDLDSRSNQPFTYHNIHIVFNGEIYNFKTIRKKLLTKGYNFKTNSDTEVVCAAYLEYGKTCLKHFNGMFSFVIYDTTKQILFGARDRLGQKPFYYYHNNKTFEFASQISSIQTHFDVNKLSISKQSIAYYFSWGNIPDPLSIFNEIKKLKAGHYFTFELNTGNLSIKQYWDIDYKNEKPYKGNYLDAKRKLNSLLKNAVASRLNADVPVGIFLSGGVDSSLIAAQAAKVSSSRIKTFSVKFNEKGFDESKYAQQVANHIGAHHHIIECNYNEGIDLIQNFTDYYDEPFSDSSAIPSMLLAKHTKKHVSVALSGDAGDESFIGYHRYFWTMKGRWIYTMPKFTREIISAGLNSLPYYRLKVISKAIKYNNCNEAYLSAMTGVDQSFIKTNIDTRKVDELKYLNHNHKKLIERISDFDTKTYLIWDINTKVDRASMAFSLEVRSPFLDHHVVAFANALPTDFKYKNGEGKRILKDVLYEQVPKHLFNRPKAGFTMPFAVWFRNELKEFVLDELNDNALEAIPCIDVHKIKFMINQHMNGTWNRYPLIWKLIVLKQWLKNNGKGYSIK